MDGTLRGGWWTRSGRGPCEISSLHLGDMIRAQVTRGHDYPPTWCASINAVDMGKHSTRDAAMQHVESAIATQMRPTIADWVTSRSALRGRSEGAERAMPRRTTVDPTFDDLGRRECVWLKCADVGARSASIRAR